jgi:tripartite-type tricarboxylate transporter receptor subunit TctC
MEAPSNAGAPAPRDLVAGHQHTATCSVVGASSLLQAGRVRTLAVMVEKRLDQAPNHARRPET